MLALLQLVACERNNVDVATEKDKSLKLSGIEASKETNIKRKEPVNFLLNSELPASSYRWKVLPNEYVFIEKGSENTTIIFDQAGTYTVVAQDSITLDSVFLSVSVGTEIYQDILEPIKGDDIISLTPVTYADSAFHIDFTALSTNDYSCSNNSLTYSLGKTGNTYQINLAGVTIPADCSGENSKAKSKIVFNWLIQENVTYGLEITLNGKTYEGSFERKGEKYQFNWPHTAGVILTAKSL
ncbi:hypothetical protein [Dyadobacter koreensis]|uniref:hypothetical protein n=1 Tax=Dyadobacter koreensis TaxID=408657 RepID=UPI001160328E|nr:hypothetical protein [Dyadobacter koreensis]